MNRRVIIKICAVLLAMALCLGAVSGCKNKKNNTTSSASSSNRGSSDVSSAVSDTDDTSSDTQDTSSASSSASSVSSSGDKTVTVTETKSVGYDASKNPLRRGVNFSSFEYDDIEIGYDNWIFQSKYYDAVREKGFDHIRLPVNFFCHMGSAPEYKIDEEFLRKIDTIINIAISSNLKIVLDFHHFGEMQTDVNGNKQKFYKMWEQLAEHYQSYPSGLVFELFNEPGNADAISKGGPDVITPEKLIEIQEQAIKIIRKTNPTRLIVHATSWNDGAAQLMNTEPLLPDDDNLIMSVHSYEPMEFTHQGADWNNTGNARPSTDFTEGMKYEIQLIFTMVKNYQEKYGRPVWIGEFGALRSKAPEGARAKYADFIVETMKDAGCGWCWWEFQSGFGLYSTASDKWIDDALMAALLK